MHGCRQLCRDVGSSPTSATLVISCYGKSTLMRLPLTKRRKVGTTSNHHAPMTWATRTTMAVNRGRQYREVEQNPKNGPSSDCRLKLAYMKLELLVIADQHAAVNTFPGLVHTARHTMGALDPKPVMNRKDAVEVRIGDWGEVVTR